jgi:hypothetical protein
MRRSCSAFGRFIERDASLHQTASAPRPVATYQGFTPGGAEQPAPLNIPGRTSPVRR